MKKFVFISTAFLLLFLSNIKAQEVAPLQLGNIWVYDDIGNIVKTTVVDTNIVIDTVVYNKLEIISSNSLIPYYRYSRLKGNGYYATRRDTSYPAPNHELLYYKKDAVIGDTWTIPEPYHPPFDRVYTIEDTNVINVFGEATTVKHLNIDSGLLLFNEFWTEKFGKLSRSDFSGPLKALKGCVIDGTVYGDTSFYPVSVEDEFAIPRDFWLKQNYPNPFNPTTTISYSIQKDGLVTLKVFDILGNEVANLVSDRMAAGNYSVSFNAANLPSGIYVYKLTSGNFTESKKLILLK